MNIDRSFSSTVLITKINEPDLTCYGWKVRREVFIHISMTFMRKEMPWIRYWNCYLNSDMAMLSEYPLWESPLRITKKINWWSQRKYLHQFESFHVQTVLSVGTVIRCPECKYCNEVLLSKPSLARVELNLSLYHENEYNELDWNQLDHSHVQPYGTWYSEAVTNLGIDQTPLNFGGRTRNSFPTLYDCKHRCID